MSSTPTITTLGNAALGVGYYCIAPKFSCLSSINLNTHIKAFGCSSLLQFLFKYRDEYNPENKSFREKTLRILSPYLIIAGATCYSDRSSIKANLIGSFILGTSQLIIGELSSAFVKNRINSSLFEGKDWNEYFGDVGEVPELPKNLDQILDEPCPFIEGETVRDTHILTLIPANLDGKAFTLNRLSEVIEKPKKGFKSKISESFKSIKDCVGNKRNPKPYWVLMSKEICVNRITHEEAVEFISKKPNYKLPSTLEAATSFLTHYVRKGEDLGYPKVYESGIALASRTLYTYCEEKSSNELPIVVGSFYDKTISIKEFNSEEESIELAGIWPVRILD